MARAVAKRLNASLVGVGVICNDGDRAEEVAGAAAASRRQRRGTETKGRLRDAHKWLVGILARRLRSVFHPATFARRHTSSHQMKLPVINLPAQPAMHSAAMLALAATLIATPFPAHAGDDKRTVGEIQGSGLVFKDTLKVEAFSDPKVSGVQLYLSDFQRPATEKFAKGDLVRSK